MNTEVALILVSIVYLIIFCMYISANDKPYVVTNINPESGTEVRRDERSIRLHVNDPIKFEYYLNKKKLEILEDIEETGGMQ